MSETQSKYINVGQIITNVDKDGNTYEQFVLYKDFIANAKDNLAHAYTDKVGNKRFNIGKPQKGAPEFVKASIYVKRKD